MSQTTSNYSVCDFFSVGITSGVLGEDPRDTRSATELQVLTTFPIDVDLMAGKHSGWSFFHPWEYFIFVQRRHKDVVSLTQFGLYVLRKKLRKSL